MEPGADGEHNQAELGRGAGGGKRSDDARSGNGRDGRRAGCQTDKDGNEPSGDEDRNGKLNQIGAQNVRNTGVDERLLKPPPAPTIHQDTRQWT